MNKRKGKSSAPMRRSPRHEPASSFYTPFQELDQLLGLHFPASGNHLDPAMEKRELHLHDIKGEIDEHALFQTAMAGVTPLPAGPREKVPLRPAPKRPHFLAEEETQSYARLVDLVAGDAPFELSNSDEYIEGAVSGICPAVLKKLRVGYFSPQDYLDLHGLNREQAAEEVRDFLMDSFAARKRCVLIIPGRGLNSRDREPVLKNSLVTWFLRAPLKRVILAFASARSYDGGWGACYVLLRKNRDKARLLTPAR